LLPIGNWEIERHGTDIAILSVGPMVYDAIDAADKLESEGISCEVVNCQFIKPMDESYLKSIIGKFSFVLTIEEGVITGGFGDGVASWLLEHGFSGSIKRLGLPDNFVEHGPRPLLLEKLHLDIYGIMVTIKMLIPEKIV